MSIRRDRHPRDGGRALPDWIVLAPILSVTFLGTVSNNVVNVPLSTILDDFDVPVSQGALIVTSWVIGVAALMPVMGWLGDRLGRKSVFVVAIAVMSFASFGAALSPSLWVLVCFRALQGCAAAAILPTVMALIGDIAKSRARGLSAWALANSLGQAVGAPLGGWLSDLFGWRAVFWPLGLLGLMALVATVILVPATPARAVRFDWRGATLLTSGTAFFLTGCSIAPQRGLADGVTVGVLVIGLALLSGFAVAIRTGSDPLVPPALFTRRPFLSSSGAAFGQMFCLGATLLAVPLYLVQEQHMSTTRAGLIVFALPAAMALFAPISGMVTNALTPAHTMRLGLTVLVLAQVALAVIIGYGMSHESALIIAMALTGIGVAFVQTPAATMASASAGSGSALGVYNVIRFSGSLVGAAWVALILHARDGYGILFVVCAGLAMLGFVATFMANGRPEAKSKFSEVTAGTIEV